MYRIFAEHTIRPVQSLNGLWTLNADDRVWTVSVPGVWESLPALKAYKGTGDYTREVEVAQEGAYLLRFGGVSHTGVVYWDGTEVARHYNAYTAFEVLLPHVQAGTHTLRVAVDNRYETGDPLHFPNDYYTYGGVNRPVEMHRVSDAFIGRMAFTCRETGEGAYEAQVEVFVRAVEDCQARQVRVCVAGAEAVAEAPALRAGETAKVAVTLAVRGVKPWDIGQGNLYDLTAQLLQDDQPVDDLIDRVSFRTVTWENEQICLNGKPVFIKGFNRHEDHPQFGSAIPVEAMLEDLHLMLDMGANSVRTCHYPNDPRFLDLCDVLGVLVWEENHARGISEETMRHPMFDTYCAQVIEEMVAQHINHPCIYVWGVLNECESATDFGRECYARQLAQLRSLDPSRPTTFASCRFFTDKCQDLPQINSFNIYPQWYHQEHAAPYAQKIVDFMDGAGAKGKPIIFSEFGAGALPGFHDPLRRAKWSEERQCDILDEQLRAFMGMERLSGVYIWQFCDVRVAEEWAHTRPRMMNNKGVVDEYRRPKMSYATVKERFKDR